MFCIAVDIDGILVDEKGLVFPEIKTVLQAHWNKADILFTSARPRDGVEYILRQIQRENHYIALNGGVIAPGIKQPAKYVYPMPFDVTARLINSLKEVSGVDAALFYDSDSWIAWGNKTPIIHEARITNSDFPQIMGDLGDLQAAKIIKCTLICETRDDATRIQSSFSTSFGNECNIAISKPLYVEITDRKISKGSALKLITEGKKFERLISIGDGFNDISMFEVSDISYTTPDAKPEVKAKANQVIKQPLVRNLARLLKSLLEDS